MPSSSCIIVGMGTSLLSCWSRVSLIGWWFTARTGDGSPYKTLQSFLMAIFMSFFFSRCCLMACYKVLVASTILFAGVMGGKWDSGDWTWQYQKHACPIGNNDWVVASVLIPCQVNIKCVHYIHSPQCLPCGLYMDQMFCTQWCYLCCAIECFTFQ